MQRINRRYTTVVGGIHDLWDRCRQFRRIGTPNAQRSSPIPTLSETAVSEPQSWYSATEHPNAEQSTTAGVGGDQHVPTSQSSNMESRGVQTEARLCQVNSSTDDILGQEALHAATATNTEAEARDDEVRQAESQLEGKATGSEVSVHSTILHVATVEETVESLGEAIDGCVVHEDAEAVQSMTQEENPYTTFNPNVDLVFVYEAETDYTPGIPKMVYASDGFQKCAAILLTTDLSHKIQRALQGRRDTKRKYNLVEQTRTSLARRKHELQIELNELTSTSSGLDRPEGVVEAFAVGKNALLEIEDEEQELDRQLDQTYKRQRILQNDVDIVLDDVFVNCRLLPLPLPEETEMMPQHSGIPVVLDTSSQPPTRAPSEHSFDDTRQPTEEGSVADARPLEEPDRESLGLLTPEEARKEAARDVLGQTHDALDTAQAEFDMREQRYNQHIAVYEIEVARGAPVPPKTEIDQMHFRYGQRLTRKLMEAEAAYENAKREAQAAGLRIGWHQESNFVNDAEDGYRESLEREAAAASIDRSRIERWLRNVPAADCEDAPEVDVDEWDARLDEPLDSVSVLAQGANRRRIDQWQTSTEQVRKDTTDTLGAGSKPEEDK